MTEEEVSTVGVTSGELASPLRLARRLRALSRHDIVHINQPYVYGMLAARALGQPVVVTVHTPAQTIRYSARGRLALRLGSACVAAWVVLSERNAAALGRPPGQGTIEVIPLGLPPARFANSLPRGQARAALGLPRDAFVVGTLGRIAAQKRHDVLIRACARLSSHIEDLRLAILGDGELAEEIRALADEILPGRVTFAGHRTDAVQLLPALDVFCLSSDFEGLPFALLEAMATGRTIVATDVEGCGEAIRTGLTGLLVQPRDEQGLADAIGRLSADYALRTRLGDAARAEFASAFIDRLMVERTITLYRRLLEYRGTLSGSTPR
jgi:glycosyltransferase involved in cell wall biosynthesis